jgi:hypothetical protein
MQRANSLGCCKDRRHFSMALTSEDEVHVWGNSTHDEQSVPEVLFADIVAGGHHAVGIDTTGKLHAWGGTHYVGSIPTPPNGYTDGQGMVPEGLQDETVIAIGAGHRTSYAILESGELVAWGSDSQNQGETNIPELLYPQYGEEWVQVTGGYNHAMALSNFGIVYHWGGDRSTASRISLQLPIQPPRTYRRGMSRSWLQGIRHGDTTT